MRYRKLSATGDYTFGQGALNFLVNTPETVGQVVQTGLLLWIGEWYLDNSVGIPYIQGVVGKHSKDQADLTLKTQILGMQGVVALNNFQTILDPITRKYSNISGDLDTIYGKTQLQVSQEGL